MSTLLFTTNKYTDVANIPFDRTRELLENQVNKFKEQAESENATT